MRAIARDHGRALTVLLAVWGTYFVALFCRAVDDRPEGLYVIDFMWSDWPLHLAMTADFAFKHPAHWFDHHPIFMDGRFTYPFLTNLISGLLIRGGASVRLALVAPSIVFSLALTVGLYSLGFALLRSRARAALMVSLFYCASGPGFGEWLRTVWLHGLHWPDQSYSALPSYQWYSGSTVGGFLLPQRAFLLGMMMAVWALLGLHLVLTERVASPRAQRRILWASGLTAGLLPITHMHSFIVVVILSIAMCTSAVRRWRQLLHYALPACVLSTILFTCFVAGGFRRQGFFSWYPGWTCSGGVLGWLRQWWAQWGLVLPLAAGGLAVAWRRLDGPTRGFFVGGIALFASANLILFQPTPWDNAKLFCWSYVALCGLCAELLAWIWRRWGHARSVAPLLAASLAFTGVLELARLQTTPKLQMLSREGLDLAERVRRGTDDSARFLTASTHNHPIMAWAARPILLGYPNWANNFGFAFEQRGRDLAAMYHGSANADALLARYRIEYVVFGPDERLDVAANESYYSRRYPIAFASRSYRVYDVRRTLTPLAAAEIDQLAH